MTLRKLSVTVFGAGGRMGSEVVRALHQEQDIEVVAAVEHQDQAGSQVSGLTTLADDPSSDYPSDVWVDVSLAEAAMTHARRAESLGRPLLIGATGFSEDERQELSGLSIPHILAPNLSLGITLLLELLPRIQSALGSGYDVGITDIHHKHKRDAPSGTALKLDHALRQAGADPQVVSLRRGEVVGEHRILFAAEGEQVEVVHRAESRMAFARGVAPAVRYLAEADGGPHTMAQVLGL